MADTVKIAGIQMASTPDTGRNIRRAHEMLDLAAERGAQIAVLPELWAYPWFVSQVDSTARNLAETEDGPIIAGMRDKARELKLCVVCPFFETNQAGDRAFNSAAMIDSQGELLGVYRKIHLPQIPGWEERSHFDRGDNGFCLFETPAGATGIQLGWDLLFPEGLRALALAGANLVIAPMAITAANDDLWQRALLSGAFANGFWLCRVSRVGSENGTTFAGASFCATPIGDFLDEPAADAEGISLWDIDSRAVSLVRREWPFLRDRQPDQYQSLSGRNDLDEEKR